MPEEAYENADRARESRIRTGISKTFWCARNEANKTFEFVPASMPSIIRQEQVAWFDELFEGGIVIPCLGDEQKRALTVLISGPPGSGKSTLALELVYRLRKENLGGEANQWHSLYVTSESCQEWLREKIEKYGWEIGDRCFHRLGDEAGGRPEIPHVDILETSNFQEYLEGKVTFGANLSRILDIIGEIFYPSLKRAAETAVQIGIDKQMEERLLRKDPDVIVIDSLNTVGDQDKSELFRRFTKLTTAGPKMIVIILDTTDSYDSRGGCEIWGYICDTIIRLDKRYDSKYMVRTLEIEKARYQSHAWGVHQLKIYGPNKLKNLSTEEARRRAHPYREEGGIFIFPSIHYYLSIYKRKSPITLPERDETRPKELNSLLNGGFPRGRCIGLIGERGNHKSHLGYLHVLHRVVKHKEKGLIVSLRDDEGMAEMTLQSILDDEKEYSKLKLKLKDLENGDRLEILYYPPGYITPEEFFHRMYLSIQRLRYKNSKARITLLFNSLDQLGARFPLCAEEQIFIPGIIEALCAEQITSLFIGVEESGQPPEQYGLLSMADVILSFRKRMFKQLDYFGHLGFSKKKVSTSSFKKIKQNLGRRPRVVILQVERFSGGETAGKGGILELVKAGTPLGKLYDKQGLCFTEFSPQFDQGGIYGIVKQPSTDEDNG
jgi:KaiC/GvpD/RAD55 family RecA-like ATPase